MKYITMNKRIASKFVILVLLVSLTISNASAYSYSMTRINSYTNLNSLNLEPECARVDYWLGTLLAGPGHSMQLKLMWMKQI